MPRIIVGSRKRLGTADNKEYTRVKPKGSSWADYDAGLTQEAPAIQESILKLHPTSLSGSKIISSRGRKKSRRTTYSSNDCDVSLPQYTTLKQPPCADAAARLTDVVKVSESTSGTRNKLQKQAAVSITLDMITPLQFIGGKHCPITIDDVRVQSTSLQVSEAIANTKKTQNQMSNLDLYRKRIDFESMNVCRIESNEKTCSSKAKELTPSSTITPGDRVFDVSDVATESQNEWKIWRRMSMSISPLRHKEMIESHEEWPVNEANSRSSAVKLTFEKCIHINIEKDLYLTETTVAPVPILVNSMSFPGLSSGKCKRKGVMENNIRWRQVAPKAFCLEHELLREHDKTDDMFTTTTAGRDLRWEAHVLKRIHKISICPCIPNPIHLCVSAKDKALCLQMECDYTLDIFGTLEDFLCSHSQYNNGGVPELVTAWLTVQIMSVLKDVHGSGVSHNNLSLQSFLLVRISNGDNWCLVVTGFGANASMNDDEKEGDWCFARDLYSVASMIWTLLTGLPFSCNKRGRKVELDHKEFITSNRFLRGALGWEDLFLTLLNPLRAHHGFHSIDDWHDLSHSLDMLNAMVPSSNKDTPAFIAAFFDTLMSHKEGSIDRLTRDHVQTEENITKIEMAKLKELVTEYQAKCLLVEQEKVLMREKMEHDHFQSFPLFEEKHKDNMRCVNDDAGKAQCEFVERQKKTALLRNKVLNLQEQLEIEMSKLKASNKDNEDLKLRLHSVMDELQESRKKRESETSLDLQLKVLKGKLVESEQDQEKLLSQVSDLKQEVQRWRSAADKIRCKALELQQKGLQLNRVQTSLGQSLSKHSVYRKSPKKSPSQNKNVNEFSLVATIGKMPTKPPCDLQQRADPTTPGNLLLNSGRASKDWKVIRHNGDTQIVVAEDPYSLNSDSD